MSNKIKMGAYDERVGGMKRLHFGTPPLVVKDGRKKKRIIDMGCTVDGFVHL